MRDILYSSIPRIWHNYSDNTIIYHTVSYVYIINIVQPFSNRPEHFDEVSETIAYSDNEYFAQPTISHLQIWCLVPAQSSDGSSSSSDGPNWPPRARDGKQGACKIPPVVRITIFAKFGVSDCITDHICLIYCGQHIFMEW